MLLKFLWETCPRGLAALAALLIATATQAQDVTAELIQIDLGRTYGLLSPKPAVLRATSVKPTNAESKTALLFFVGWPGMLWLPERIDSSIYLSRVRQSGFYALTRIEDLPRQGIRLVLVDCPTDEWGVAQRSPDPYGCSDSYRASERHAADVSQLIQTLRQSHGVEKVYLMGHSYGSISSRWLAIRLGTTIQGSIHSASMNSPGGGRFTDYASSVPRMDMGKATAPWVFMHHQDDQCPYTRYGAALAMAGPDKLMSVKGGIPKGDPCGGGHLHSYLGREEPVMQAVARWILTGEVTRVVGE